MLPFAQKIEMLLLNVALKVPRICLFAEPFAFDALDLLLRQMSFHCDVAEARRQRAPGDPVRRQRRRDDRAAGNRERRREVGAEVAAEFPVDGRLAEGDERTTPPLYVVVAGNHEHRRGFATQIGERAAALELAMASS